MSGSFIFFNAHSPPGGAPAVRSMACHTRSSSVWRCTYLLSVAAAGLAEDSRGVRRTRVVRFCICANWLHFRVAAVYCRPPPARQHVLPLCGGHWCVQ
jgi:hypothetical protein